MLIVISHSTIYLGLGFYNESIVDSQIPRQQCQKHRFHWSTNEDVFDQQTMPYSSVPMGSNGTALPSSIEQLDRYLYMYQHALALEINDFIKTQITALVQQYLGFKPKKLNELSNA